MTAAHTRLASLDLGTMGQDLTLRVFDQDRNIIAQSSNTGVQNESVQWQMTAGESYFFVVAGSTSNATRYDLQLRFSDTNDSFEQAEELQFGSFFINSVGYHDPEDFYRFQADETGTLELSYFGAQVDFQIEVYDSQFNLIATGIHDRDLFSVLETPIIEGETYYVRVNAGAMENNRLDIGFGPSISATVLPAIPDNNESLSTSSVRSDTFTESNFVGSFDADDFYSFTASATGTVTVSLTGLTSDLAIRIYNSSGVFVVESGSASIESDSISFHATENADYFIRVSPVGGSFSDYTIDVSIDDSPLIGEGDILANTDSDARLVNGATIESDLDAAGDRDWFQITVLD